MHMYVYTYISNKCMSNVCGSAFIYVYVTVHVYGVWATVFTYQHVQLRQNDVHTFVRMCLAACIHRLLQGFSFFWIHVVHGEGPHIPSVYHKAGLCLHQVSVKRCRCIVNLCTHTCTGITIL